MKPTPVLVRTCLSRTIGRCPGCKIDYDPLHKPNNLNCPGYREIYITIYVVTKKVNI